MSNAGKPNSIDQRAQPAGVPRNDANLDGVTGAAPADQRLFDLHHRLCELIEDADERVERLGIPAAVDAAWREGRMLPVLRAHGKKLQLAIASIEHDRAKAAD